MFGGDPQDNEHDSYGLRLTMRLESPSAAPTDLGTFRIHRRDHGQQFPPEMWAAVSDPVSFVQRRRGGCGASAVHPDVDVDTGDVELVLATLKARLHPFTQTAASDLRLATAASRRCLAGACCVGGGGVGEHDVRRGFAAMYRDGQRRVLEEAVEALERMLLS